MMRDRRTELLLRQRHLQGRSAELRLTTASQAQALKAPLAAVDQVYAGVRWLQSHPQWPAGALLLLTFLRPRRAIRWTSRIWWGWATYKRARQWLAGTSAQTF